MMFDRGDVESGIMGERPQNTSMRVCLSTFLWLCGVLCAVIAAANASTQPHDRSRHVTSLGLPCRLCRLHLPDVLM
jgi:hypothetical protein